MEFYTKIWNLSKLRFLQAEARLWIFNNKLIEILFFIGGGSWVYLEFFYVGKFFYIKYLSLFLTLISIYIISSRLSLYQGYFSGYEKRFGDAAVKNLDYWGETHTEASDSFLIHSALEEIESNEEKISKKNKNERADEIKEGLSQMSGIILTWRKVK